MGSSKYNGWNTKPKLDEARVIAGETPPTRSRKDRRRWCRGKVGVGHNVDYAYQKDHRWRTTADRALPRCRWHYNKYNNKWWWHCEHTRACTECGRIFDGKWSGLGRKCPDYKPRETTMGD